MSSAPAECNLNPDPGHACLVLVVAASAVLALFLTRLPAAACAALSVLLLAAAWREVCEHAWRAGPRAVRRVCADAAGWWLYTAHGAGWGPARAISGRVWPGGVLLVLRDAGGVRRRLLVLRNASRPDALRRLRVRALADLDGPAA